MIFASDNWSGASDKVAEALAAEGRRSGPAYAGDALTRTVEDRFSDLFGRKVAAFAVATGTAANALALSAFARPGGIVLCHTEAHINADECNTPEFLNPGTKIVGLPGIDGRIAPGQVTAELPRYTGHVEHGQLAAVSISETTELGALYTPEEVAAMAGAARAAGVPLHMDGARFANAVAALGCTPADITWKAGVDVLSFGGSKNGCYLAEAVIFFDPDKARDFPYIRKRSGHLLSKTRFIAAQFEAYLADGHWLELAGHANTMAARLAAGIAASPNGRLAVPTQGNEVFACLKREAAARCRSAGAAFHDWSTKALAPEAEPAPDEVLVRLVANFRTTAAEVDAFLGHLG